MEGRQGNLGNGRAAVYLAQILPLMWFFGYCQDLCILREDSRSCGLLMRTCPPGPRPRASRGWCKWKHGVAWAVSPIVKHLVYE